MSVEGNRELFLLLCSGLLETYCARVEFEGARFGVASSSVASRGAGATMVLDFSEAAFVRAVAVTEESAASLWPERQPRRRAVQLMLVHADEQIATTRGTPDLYAMTVPGGYVTISPRGAGSEAAVAAADEEAALAQERLRSTVDEGSRAGQTFEWR